MLLVDLAQGSRCTHAVSSGLLNETRNEEIDMSHVQHELADEFPDDHQILHYLKLNDAHFVKLSDAHHDLNREIHRIESGVEAASDDRLESLKKQRLTLLDDVAQIIAKTKAA
jgi:hypothetical protein